MVSRHFRAAATQTRYPRVEDIFDAEGIVGEGTYGIVFKVRRKTDGLLPDGTPRWYALKGMKSSASPQRDDGLSIAAMREIAILRDLQHPNIVTAEGMYMSHARKEVWLLFDYAEYDLWTLISRYREIKKRGNTGVIMPSEVMQKSVMKQILEGIDYLHSNWILHRDLKPANILVMGDGPERGCVKIADLGMARLFHSPLKSLSDVDPVVVTFWYRAPELLLGAKHYTKAIDLWAIGCIMAELITVRPLFWAKDEQKTKDPYHREQLAAIFNCLGFPTHVTRPAKNELEWQNLRSLPAYPRFAEDFKQELARAQSPDTRRGGGGGGSSSGGGGGGGGSGGGGGGGATSGLSTELKRLIGPAAGGRELSRAKLSLLVQLLRPDPQQRMTTALALLSRYFQEAPLPQNDVLSDTEGITFNKRAFLDKRKRVKGGSMKCSIETFQSRAPKRRAQGGPENPVAAGEAAAAAAAVAARSSATATTYRGHAQISQNPSVVAMNNGRPQQQTNYEAVAGAKRARKTRGDKRGSATSGGRGGDSGGGGGGGGM